MWTRRSFVAAAGAALTRPLRAADVRKLYAGAATANITPALGCSLAGNMQDHIGVEVHDELHVRAFALDNGQGRIAFATVDSCAVPRSVMDAAKALIEQHTQIPAAQVLISATHSHSCPAAAHLFQSPPDPKYVEFLTWRIADAVRLAVKRLEPAQVGWAKGSEPSLLFNRRYFMKQGVENKDPFGGVTDKVKMNPGVGNPNIDRPSGPKDSDLWMLAVHSVDGRPIAVVGNYALHYVGGTGPGHISADYFPMWGESLLRQAGITEQRTVPILTNACSGNLNGVNFMGAVRPNVVPYVRMKQVADTLATESLRVWRSVKFESWVELRGSVEELELGVRLPSAEDVARAKALIGEQPGNQYKKIEEVYARETILLARDYPKTQKVVLQGLRIGSFGVGTFPGEAFCELGLEVKQKSPFPSTMLVELANGYHGYLPTVEGHHQGGYETWRAKSSYLEVEAAPKMVAAVLRRLGSIAG